MGCAASAEHPFIVRAAIDAERTIIDTYGAAFKNFIETRCVVGYEQFVPWQTLSSAFEYYLESNGQHELRIGLTTSALTVLCGHHMFEQTPGLRTNSYMNNGRFMIKTHHVLGVSVARFRESRIVLGTKS